MKSFDVLSQFVSIYVYLTNLIHAIEVLAVPSGHFRIGTDGRNNGSDIPGEGCGGTQIRTDQQIANRLRTSIVIHSGSRFGPN